MPLSSPVHVATSLTQPSTVRSPRRANILSRLHLTYAMTPPNRTTAPERRRVIAETQSARIAKLPIDALLVYDLQDETARNSKPRPFPFTPKVDALAYAQNELELGELPLIVYKAIADQNAESLMAWLNELAPERSVPVFVGAPSRHRASALTLPQTYAVCRAHSPALPFGGVLIAERHHVSGDEALRAWSKVQQGCRFFVSQTLWSVEHTKSLLCDLVHRAALADRALPQLLVTLSPCGSEPTLRFQQWLGVAVPSHIERELLGARDMLAHSIELAYEAFTDVHAFAAELGITLGCNVESVSTKPSEVEASIELTRRIASYQAQATARSIQALG